MTTNFEDRIDAAAVLFVNPRGELLLHLRDDIPTIRFPNHWGFIGGQVDPGETIDEALRRESVEEIGEVLGDVTFWGTYESIAGGPGPLVDLYVFVAALDKPAESLPLTEGQRVAYFLPADALKLTLIPSLRAMLPPFSESDLYRSFIK